MVANLLSVSPPSCQVTLGIDPGTALMGYGVITQASIGSALQCVTYGCLRTPSGMPMPQRLAVLYEGIQALIAAHHPSTLAIEELFFSTNARTAISVAQARGVALLCGAQAAIEVTEYTPLQVKQAVVGYGRATKDQIQQMVRTLLALTTVPRPDDAADALAVAICHTHSARLAPLMAGR